MAAPSPAEIQYQKAHIHENKAPDIIASHVICFVLACIAVTLRFIARRIKKAPIKADDWFIVVALVSKADSKCPLEHHHTLHYSSVADKLEPTDIHSSCDGGQLYIGALWTGKTCHFDQTPGKYRTGMHVSPLMELNC